MKRLLIIHVLALLMICNSGCAWLGEILIGAAVGETRFKDGRDKDADGLTQRDIVARGEESVIRSWDHERRMDQLKDSSRQHEAQQDPPLFGKAWQDHLSNQPR